MTVSGLVLGRLIGGTVVVESLFGLPGIGRLTLQSIQSNDYATVQGVVIVIAVSYVVINTVVDVLIERTDPRARRTA